jgi:small-conductance mechanosensitive channel
VATQLRKKTIFFVTFALVVSAALVLLPLFEPYAKTYIADLFGSNDSQMGETATSLFEHLLRIFKVILWMALIIGIVRFFTTAVLSTVFRKTSSYELSTLVRNVLAIVIYIVSFFIIFKSQYPNIDLAALFTTSTILGVIIGLALQDTLGNLFAGIAMQADQPFQVGDVINVPGKGTGIIETVSWRGVKIRTFQNKLVVISNSVLGKEAIEVAPRDNLNARLVFFSTVYGDSPSKTIQVVREVVRQVENVSAKMRPIVRIKGFGDSSIDWEVKYWLEDYAKYNDTDALLRQRIWYAFRRESLSFAFPVRVLNRESKSPKPIADRADDDVIERLENVALFAPLSEKEIEKLAYTSAVRIFAPGEFIVRKGQEGGSMFVVHRGGVKIQVMEAGFPKTVTVLNEGDIFGEMGLFTGEPRTADVVASEETKVLEIKHSAVKPLFESNPNLVEQLSKTIAERKALLAQNASPDAVTMEQESSGVVRAIRRFFRLK